MLIDPKAFRESIKYEAEKYVPVITKSTFNDRKYYPNYDEMEEDIANESQEEFLKLIDEYKTLK